MFVKIDMKSLQAFAELEYRDSHAQYNNDLEAEAYEAMGSHSNAETDPFGLQSPWSSVAEQAVFRSTKCSSTAMDGSDKCVWCKAAYDSCIRRDIVKQWELVRQPELLAAQSVTVTATMPVVAKQASLKRPTMHSTTAFSDSAAKQATPTVLQATFSNKVANLRTPLVSMSEVWDVQCS